MRAGITAYSLKFLVNFLIQFYRFKVKITNSMAETVPVPLLSLC